MYTNLGLFSNTYSSGTSQSSWLDWTGLFWFTFSTNRCWTVRACRVRIKEGGVLNFSSLHSSLQSHLWAWPKFANLVKDAFKFVEKTGCATNLLVSHPAQPQGRQPHGWHSYFFLSSTNLTVMREDWGSTIPSCRVSQKKGIYRKHRKYCESSPTQVTWKVNFKCQFCLSCRSSPSYPSCSWQPWLP